MFKFVPSIRFENIRPEPQEGQESSLPATEYVAGEFKYGCFLYRGVFCSITLNLDDHVTVTAELFGENDPLGLRGVPMPETWSFTQPLEKWRVAGRQAPVCQYPDQVEVELKRLPFRTENKDYEEPQRYSLRVEYAHCYFVPGGGGATAFIRSEYEFAVDEVEARYQKYKPEPGVPDPFRARQTLPPIGDE